MRTKSSCPQRQVTRGGKGMKGLKLRGIVGLFILVLCIAAVLVADVYKQNTYVRLSIAGTKIGKQKAEIRNELALLEVKISVLKKYSRIESIAKSRFGLEYGITPILVYSDKANKAQTKSLAFGKVAWRTKGL